MADSISQRYTRESGHGQLRFEIIAGRRNILHPKSTERLGFNIVKRMKVTVDIGTYTCVAFGAMTEK